MNVGLSTQLYLIISPKHLGHPEPYVQWRKDINGLGPNIRVLPDSTLEIRPTTAADQGLFGCEATNPVGTDYQASALILVGM